MQTNETLLATLKKNDEIARKFQAIETKILSILNFNDLFEILLAEIRNKFQVPYVWLTLIEKERDTDILGILERSKILETDLNIVSSGTFFGLIPRSTQPLLVNDDLKPFYRLFPPIKKFLVKSMAIAPITLDGQIIGSLNQADFSYLRFTPGIDTSLLENLALKVSLCLANVTAHEKLKFLAYHDPLTGSLNRRVMESILRREFQRARRYNNSLSLAFLDIDYFKKINDRYGHDIGDETLVHLSRNLERMVRNSDVVARFAGDEFIVILPETTPKEAIAMMDRIRTHFLEHPLILDDIRIPISISFGIADVEDTTIDTAEALIKAADTELYRMKKGRK